MALLNYGIEDTGDWDLVPAVSSALAGTEIDFSGNSIRTKTLSANTVFTIINPVQGRTLVLVLDGSYTVTLPASVTVVESDYSPGLGTNYLWLWCADSGTPTYLAAWKQPV